jgi:hypothetical protein
VITGERIERNAVLAARDAFVSLQTGQSVEGLSDSRPVMESAA